MSSRSPSSPGAFSPSEPCQQQLNIRKLFKGLFHISRNPFISSSLMMSSCAPSQAMTCRLGRWAGWRWPALPQPWGQPGWWAARQGARMEVHASSCLHKPKFASSRWQQCPRGEVQCYAVSGQRARALWSVLSRQRIDRGQTSREDRLNGQGGERAFMHRTWVAP